MSDGLATVWVKESNVLQAGLGVSEYMFRKAVRTGTIVGRVLPGMKQKRFLREDVLKVFGTREELKSGRGTRR